MDSAIALPASKSLTDPDPNPQVSAAMTYHLLAERVLKESNDYIDSILASITDAFFIITPSGEIQTVNQAACDLLGYGRSELIGQTATLILGDSSLLTDLAAKEPSESGLIQDIERTLYTKDQRSIPVSISSLLRRDEFGRIQGVVCVARDLRERKRTVAALYQSEARNLAFLRAIPDLILRISRYGIYLDVVPAEGFENINYDLIGKHLCEILSPELAQQQLHLIDQTFQTGEIQVCEYSLRVEGSVRYQEARIVACGDDEALMIVRDITERKQAEEMNALLATVVEHAVDAIEITDSEERIQYVNPAFENLTGYERTDVLGKTQSSLFSHQYDATLYERVMETVSSGQVWQGDVIATRKDGSLYQQEAIISPVHNPLGNITHYVAVKRDVTERKRAEAALKRYQLLSQHARDIVIFTRLDGQIVEANDAAIEAYAYDRQDLLTLRVHDLIDPASAASLNEQTDQALDRGLLYETIHRRRDGLLFPVEVSVQGAIIGDETLLLSIIRDITARKQVEAELYHNAFHDSLTGLPNRALFLERLKRSLQRAKDVEYQFAVLFLDLDGFKVINDSLGHLAGDHLLVEITKRLQRCLKPEDTLARFGGDEFTILVENIANLQEVTKIAERIQQEISHPLDLDGQVVFTATSIGIVLNNSHIDQPEDLLRSADTALYQAKAQGGTRYVVFDTEMHNRALQRLRTETDLRRAITEAVQMSQIIANHQPLRSEFQVYYQPIVALKNQQISGFEALVRWQHPERGMISPGEFIPIAEETGLIVPIGWLVLREACLQMRLWHDQFPSITPLSISVNLSVKQFSQMNLVRKIRQILDETGLNPRSLKLEITESAIMENAEMAAKMMHELQALGVQLSLDDFGTGYSSLAYLHRLPIDTLKVDRSFISRIDSDGEQLEIVRAIVTLAWNLGMDIVAEGVETNKQLNQLKALRCEYAQGYFFSHPVPYEAATALLTKPC